MEKQNTVNNTFYDSLNSLWHSGNAHPIALLRAENSLRNPWIRTILENRIGKKCTILDIGCGGGLLTNTLAKAGHAVFGIDLSENSLEMGRQKDDTASVTYLQASAEALPFPDETFDVVCAMDLLEHVEDPALVIAEAGRVLKKNGLFFFHTFNRTFLSWLMVIKGVEWCVRDTPPHMHLYNFFITPDEIKEMCFAKQMKVEKIVGMIPDMKSIAFWKMVLLREVPDNFRFHFTSSLKTGYTGYAVKQ